MKSTIIHRARPRGLRPPQPMPSTVQFGGPALAQLLGVDTTNSVYVSEHTVRGLPAIDAGVMMIAHGVATMMTSADVITPAGDHVDPLPPIVERPNVLLGRFEFWAQAVACAVMRGNYVGILTDFDFDGYARQVVPIHPDAVVLDDTSGLPFYEIGGTRYRWDEVVHVRHGAPVGQLWGMGVVEKYRKALSGQLHEQSYGEASFRSGAVPSAIVQLDVNDVKDTVAKQVQEDWIENHGRGQRKPAVIPKTMNITPIGWSPEDAEFIEAKRLSIAEAALMCGLHPSDLGATVGSSGQLTYANLTERQIARITDSYGPWLELVEQAWTDLVPGANTVAGNPEALLRTSTKERYEIHELAQRIGIQTAEETRIIEKRPATNPDPAPAPDPDNDQVDPESEED